MSKSNVSQKLLDSAVNLLSYRPRSEAEIRFRLQRKRASPQEIEKIVNRLKATKLINDREFCLWWQQARDAHRPRSSRLLKAELRQKGVSREIIDQTIDASLASDLKRARKALQKKYARHPLNSQSQSAIRFLASRGFSWEIIREACNLGSSRA